VLVLVGKELEVPAEVAEGAEFVPQLELNNLNLAGILPAPLGVPPRLDGADGAAGRLGDLLRRPEPGHVPGEVQDLADVAKGQGGDLLQDPIGFDPDTAGALGLGAIDGGADLSIP